jgi:hypothetical protein
MHQKTIRYVVKAYFYQINFTEQTQKGLIYGLITK